MAAVSLFDRLVNVTQDGGVESPSQNEKVSLLKYAQSLLDRLSTLP